MRRFFQLFLIILLLLIIRGDSYAQIRRETKSKQLIVTFRQKPKAADLINLSKRKRKSRLKFALANTNSMVYEPVSGDVQGAIEELATDPVVESAVADRILDLLYLPNDLTLKATPNPGKPRLQWDMFNLNLAGTGRTAWDISRGSSQVIVAVLDSGYDSIHEDLAGKFVTLIDCTTGPCHPVSSMTADSNDLDDSHGTHVAGIIGASTDNTTGMAGSGFNTAMMGIKIRNANGEMLVSYFVNAIRYAADQGARIINMSLGSLEGNLDGPVISQINDAVSYAWSKNLLLVAAAGNCGWDTSHHRTSGDPCDIYDANGNFIRHAVNEKFYPAASANVLSVAALDINNLLAPYSEHNDATAGNWVSVAASGGMFATSSDREYGIASTWPSSSYYFNLGTSAAAPHVSGIAGLIWALKPTLSNFQLKTLIEQTANKSIAAGTTNFGMIDSVKALDSVNIPFNTPTRTPTRSPTPSATKSPTPTRSPTPFISPTRSVTPSRTPTPINPTSPTAPAGKPGDANGDNKVDGVDYVIWLTNYNKQAFGASRGDFNNSSFVDGLDYVIWRNNYNK